MPRLGRAQHRLLTFLVLVVGAALLMPAHAGAQAPAQTSGTTGEQEFWPALNATFTLTPRVSLQALVERRRSEDSDYLLWRAGATFSYQAMRRVKRPEADVEEENRHYIVLGGGYEYIRTYENGVAVGEHRVGAQFTPKRSVGFGFLLQDRNRLEFRWKADGYAFRYRNKLTLDRPVQVGEVALIPYASGELFWDGDARAWNQRRYALGVRLPYRKSLVLDAYYLRKTCTDCTRTPVNAVGLTVGWYVRQKRQ